MRIYKAQALKTPALGLVLRLRSVGIQWGRRLYVVEWRDGDGAGRW